MKAIYFLVLLPVVLLTGCGIDVDVTLVDQLDSLKLVPVDTIGVFYGDTLEMFGNITDAILLPSNELVVVDGMRRCAMVFDSSGTFTRQIARSGSGPGEFQFNPTNVIWIPGSQLIAMREDATGDWLTYTANGDFVQRRDIAENIIMDIVFIDDSTSVCYTVDVDWNSLDVSYSVNSQNMNTGQSVGDILFYERPLEDSSDFLPGYVMLTTDGTGRLFLSKASHQHWLVEVYSMDGNLLSTLERTDVSDRKPVVQPDDPDVEPVIPGIDPFSVLGTDENGMSRKRTTTIPVEHPIISGIAMDADGHLWSRRGGFPGNTWDISDTEGNRIAVVDVALPDSVCHNLIINSHGYIAIDNRSSDFHRVYIMELEEK